jgi:hypothetical protein
VKIPVFHLADNRAAYLELGGILYISLNDLVTLRAMQIREVEEVTSS